MVFDAEPRGCQFLDPFEALFEFENPAARAAQKMVVVSFVSALVARGFARDLDRHDLPVARERFERAVNRGDPDRGDILQRQPQNFHRRQRVPVVAENRLDRPLLPGASVHW